LILRGLEENRVRRLDRAWRQAIVAILVGVGLAVGLGYAGIWPQASPGAPNVQLAHTLLVWSGFPANENGRPLVLAGSRMLAPASGFPDKADQTAYTNGAIDPPSSYPTTPALADGYRLISPSDAVALIQTAGANGPRLRITKVTLGTGTFQTDRGPRLLPAWLVWFAGVRDPVVVAAARPFNPAGVVASSTPAIRSATVNTDTRQLTVAYNTGGHPCKNYTLEVEESRTAVAIAAVELRSRASTCLAIRRSTVTLTKPLDGRVLVDGVTGEPVTVTEPGQALGPPLPRRLPGHRHRLHLVVHDARVADHSV
jgi:hypothetical protein